jgi:aspartate aminotransferase
MSLSLIAQSIKPSPTLALNAKAALLREKGEPVIHLGGGEPKSQAPMDALLAAVNILNTGEVRYAPADGNPELKKAIINYTKDFYHRQVNVENVIASSGAKQAIMVAFQALLDPQDEVIFPVPYWVSYPDMVRLCGAVPVPVYPADGSFYPTLKDIEKNVTSKTKIVIINSPNNPSGVYYSSDFIAQVVEYCEKKGIYLIMDDIYHRLLFDGKKTYSAYDYTKELVENSKIIVVNGVSKQYAMTGFRIGWAVGNSKVIKAMANIQGHQTSGPSVVMMKAAAAAINGVQSSVETLRLNLENSRNILVNALRAIPGVKLSVPDGTFYSFADFSAFEKDSQKLSQFLIEKVMVLTVPGKEFGLDGHLRISYCGSIKDITEGIERIKWALDPNSPSELYIGNHKIVREW